MAEFMKKVFFILVSMFLDSVFFILQKKKIQRDNDFIFMALASNLINTDERRYKTNVLLFRDNIGNLITTKKRFFNVACRNENSPWFHRAT